MAIDRFGLFAGSVRLASGISFLVDPANPPKPRKAGPGRPKGTRRDPRTRHPAIKKTA